ncbi:hypothetical protein CXB51_007324 [Gossypium anomalum]|uniref:DUF7745 domain-containing protein n=1 Tax=Gossypium anomalum TaxID=47600 RepID=A0A8J6D758_9ROSI|nr:hypothetical protein CXB51_007324 [Gossypium anomalum]
MGETPLVFHFLYIYIVHAKELNRWDSDTRGIFTENYGDIAHLIAVNVDEQLIQAMVRFWDPAYQCFTFNQKDMTPTIEEYAALLLIDNVQFSNIYVKEPKPMTFKKKLVRLKGMTDMWAEKQIKKKNKVLGHIEVAVMDFFERLRQGINPVPTILAETFRSLNCCRRKGEGCFIGCAQLFNVWILSHFWKVERTPFHMFSKTFAPLKAYLEKDWPKDVTEHQDWVPLLGLWGGVGYAPLMVQRQFTSRQFIPATGGLTQSKFAFTGEGYMKRVRDTAKSWKEIHLMELALYADTIT